MNSLLKRLMTHTENGMPTNANSGSFALDMFYSMGALRKADDRQVLNYLANAYREDPLIARKLVFHNRNIRGGQGERRTFRLYIKWLAENDAEAMLSNLHLVPVYGRWDDLFALYGTQLEAHAQAFIATALWDGNALAAKWMPREGKAGFDEYARPLIKFMGLNFKGWRELLAYNTSVIETLMCAGRWDLISYEHTPSKALLKYRKAFERHDYGRYHAYLAAVEKGEAKINAGALYPHDLVSKVLMGDNSRQLDLQWNALPDYVAEGLSFLPVVDVSGSMAGEPIQVAIALGLYLSERNKSTFKDGFITFSNRPQLQYVSGSLSTRVSQLRRADWDMNTDLEKVFSVLLYSAERHAVSPEDMPTHIIILSDMQFDQCVESDDDALTMVRNKYERAGYKVPQVVFWNLRSSNGVPATMNEEGVALLSGFSPSAMEALLAGEDLSPYRAMLKALEKYTDVV